MRQQNNIAAAHALETSREAVLKAAPPTSPRPVHPAALLPLEKQADRDRRQRPREPVGRQHGKHHRKTEGREQIFRRSMKENN